MTQKRKLTRRDFLHLAPAMALIGAAAPEAQADDAVGAVANVSGKATAERNKTSRGLGVSSAVFLGDGVSTAANARLGLMLAGKTRLNLAGASRVTIDKYLVNSGGVLELGQGAITVSTKPGAFPDGLKVKSPYALLAVRGTRFYAGQLDKVFSVFVESGEVRVSAAGRAVTLGPGDGTGIKARGDKPGAVKRWKPPKIAKFKALFA